MPTDVETLQMMLEIISALGGLLLSAFIYNIAQNKKIEKRLSTAETRIRTLDKTINDDIAEMKLMLQSYHDILTDLRIHVSRMEGENAGKSSKK